MLHRKDAARRQWCTLVGATALAGMLAGCGGGGDGSSSPPKFTGGNAPVITLQPSSQTVAAGSTGSFSVAATGDPAPTYQWELSPDGGVTFANISGATASSYTTPVTTQADSGKEFVVVVSNSQGMVTSQAATLTVTP